MLLAVVAHGSAAWGASPTNRARSVHGDLLRLLRAGQISHAAYERYRGTLDTAAHTAGHLGGTRRRELEAVLQNLRDIAGSGRLTASRLPVLFLTLQRNLTWWSRGSQLSSGQRVQFSGSELAWEYYPGQGIELQQLGSWGQVDWMFQAGRRFWPRMLKLVDELIPLAAERGGGLAWEYYFAFGGGAPPWTSAMSQATALQALTEAYEATRDPKYLNLAHRALPVFRERPPTGVSVVTARGLRYLLYSFDSGQAVINGFLQTLIGLYDYAHVTRNAAAQGLFAAGDAEARHELPSYDTGAWSLYQPGEESSLDYHTLVTGFLQQLCSRTRASVYCRTAARFTQDLRTPPRLQLLTPRIRPGRSSRVWFRVSKVGRVGITITHGGHTVFLTGGDFTHGVHSFTITPLGRGGADRVTLDSTDLAGNYGQASFSFGVS